MKLLESNNIIICSWALLCVVDPDPHNPASCYHFLDTLESCPAGPIDPIINIPHRSGQGWDGSRTITSAVQQTLYGAILLLRINFCRVLFFYLFVKSNFLKVLNLCENSTLEFFSNDIGVSVSRQIQNFEFHLDIKECFRLPQIEDLESTRFVDCENTHFWRWKV